MQHPMYMQLAWFILTSLHGSHAFQSLVHTHSSALQYILESSHVHTCISLEYLVCKYSWLQTHTILICNFAGGFMYCTLLLLVMKMFRCFCGMLYHCERVFPCIFAIMCDSVTGNCDSFYGIKAKISNHKTFYCKNMECIYIRTLS